MAFIALMCAGTFSSCGDNGEQTFKEASQLEMQGNEEEAVKLYHKAAEEGHAIAQLKLGTRYYYGNGVEENREEAVKWYKKAANQGEPTAQLNLGLCYYYGDGIEEDYEEAVKWVKKAADQGDLSAQTTLENITK